MAKLFILIRRKGSKRFLGAIPTKKNATRASLKKKIRKQLRSGFSARIVTENQLKQVVERMRPRKALKKIRKTRKRKLKSKRRRRK